MAIERLQSLVSTGQFLSAYREVEKLLLDPELDPSLKAKIYLIGVRSAAGIREVYAAAKMAEKAVEAAELGSDWEDIGNSRLYSALIYREIGDTALAIRFFHLFFDYLDRYPQLQSRTGYAYYNLGLTHQQRRDYDQALRAYRLAIEDFEFYNDRFGVLISLQNSAWTLLLQGLPGKAEPLLQQASVLSQELERAEYQVTQLVVEALYARLTQNPERATALCEEVFQPERQGRTPLHMAEAAWIMADLTLEADRLHEAGIFSDQAVNYAMQAKEPHLMNLATDVRRRVLSRKSALQTGSKEK